MRADETIPEANAVSRRTFITSMTALGGSLVVGFHVPLVQAQTSLQGGALAPNAFIRIDRSTRITIVLPYVEMGQGAYTAQAQLIAEELEVDLDRLAIEHAPPDEKLYSHPVFGDQITGGSAGLRGAWEALRHAGANTRALLVNAAAHRWGVDPASCAVQRGEVTHASSGRRAPYAELVDDAARLPVPDRVPLKDPSRFRLIGKPVKRVDTPSKVNGTAKYGIDAAPAGVKFAAVAACPVFGGTLGAVDESKARSVRGVRQIVKLDDAVAVIADHTWAARKGLAALQITWNEGANAKVDTAQLLAACDSALDQPGVVASTKGDIAAAEARATSHYDAVFRLPMLAHLALEPINCTAHVRDDGCEIWVGCQRLALGRRMAAEACGLPPDKIVIHNHLLGGGFGRRLEADYVAQAVRIARQVKGPVKVIWSREEDVQHDYYRYHNHSRVRVAIDAQRKPLGFSHKLAGPAVMARWLPIFFKDGVDLDITGSAAGPYDWPNLKIEYVRHEAPRGLATGNWRGVGPTRNVFIVESVIDDLARDAGRDPVEYRRALLDKAPRARAVLDLVAKVANWGSRLPAGRGRGIALLHDFDSYVAQVAEVTVDRSGALRVDRVICAVDCGMAVNPDIVKAQMEGGIIYGLSAVLYGRITVANGRIQQGNFDDCPVLRMHESPRIEVYVVASTEAPGGVGEPGTSAVFPAVRNAICAVTGKRLYSLPVDPGELRSV
jgi:isoquinoline 1-oxidoreductase beta subunit